MAAAARFSRLAGLRNVFRLSGATVRPYHQLTTKYMEAVKNLPETTVTELPNGLKVATEFTDSPIANVGLWIEAGSRYEPRSLNGAANFFEHLVFRGSRNRSRRDLETEINRLGAELHASTGREETVFSARCLPGDVATCVDVLADAVRNPLIDAGDVEEQRKVILSEMEAVATDPRTVTFDYLHLTAYQGTQLENSVFGPSENVERMTGDDVRSYADANFTAARTVLVGTGNVKHDDVVRLAEKHLGGDLASGSSSVAAKTCRFTGSDVRYRDDWMPFAHAAIAVDTCGYTSPDVYPLMLAKTHIGAWDKTAGCSANTSYRLVEHIYKGKGCHSFDSFHLLYRDTGLWGCYFVMDGMSLDDFVYNLQDEWMKLCVSATDADLVKAKARLRNEMSFCMEDGGIRSLSDVGREVHCFGARIPVAEAVERIESVTLSQLKDVCSKYIYDRCPAVASVGPVEAMPDYNRVRSGMFWLRY